MKPGVLITGATGYFGKYLVEGLVDRYQVIAVSRNPEKLQELFPDDGVTKAALDLSNLAEVREKTEAIAKEHQIHGLINNAYEFSKDVGFNTPEGKLEELDFSKVERSLRSGLLAPFILIQTLGKQMIERSISGSIINISSIYGSVSPNPKLYEGTALMNPASYGMVKGGMDALTRYVASFWGKNGIRCNSIAPGAFPNVETDSANAPKNDAFLETLKEKTVLNRVGHPRDLLGLVRLLLSEESSYITGQTMFVDGGWTTN